VTNEGESPQPVPGLDLGSLMSQVLQARAALESAQQAAASQVVEGTAGGGAVRVRVTGGLQFQSVTIDPSVVDPAEAELLGDLVLAAVREAVEQASALSTQALGGLDLGAIQGLLGGA
jgi:DNA-binding YbaB/EbfC family protein